MWKHGVITIIVFQVWIHCSDSMFTNLNEIELANIGNIYNETVESNNDSVLHYNISSTEGEIERFNFKRRARFLKKLGFLTIGILINVTVVCCWVLSRNNKRVLNNNNLEFQQQQQQQLQQRLSPTVGNGTPRFQRRAIAVTTGQIRLCPGSTPCSRSRNNRQAQTQTACNKSHEKLTRKDSTPPPSYSSLQIHYAPEIKSIEIPIVMDNPKDSSSKYPPAYTP